MAVAPLPPALEDRLAALAARVRRLQLARGVCRVIASLLLSAVAIVLLDAACQLSVTCRCILQVGWLGLGGFLGWQLVVRPWQSEIPLEEIARQVEGRFPGLGERLLTVVGLREDADPANGSPQLIASLARDTEIRTRTMDFAQVAPVRPVAQLAVATGAVLVAVLIASATIPGTGVELRRVGMPWHRQAIVAPFEVVVASGDPVVRRGDPVTLTAYLRPTDPTATLPDAAVLVFRDDPGGPERKLPMTGDGTAAFHATRPTVVTDFEYHVEVGPAASEWHTVRVADPVDLTDQTAAEIAPPPYAAGLATKSAAGLTDLDGLQFSTATIRLRFTRPAESAVLEWRPDGRAPSEVADVIPVDLVPDRTGGAATFRMKANGVLRVVLVNEPGPRRYRTEIAIPVRTAVDTPPRFEQVSGVTTQPRSVRPGEQVPVGLVAADDVGVGAAELEYAVGAEPGKTVRIPIPLTGADAPQAEGRLLFALAGKGREGETIRFRVRVRDNRRVEDEKLGPQEAVYPPTGWAELRLSESAPPLDRQEIFGQRDGVRSGLSTALREVKATHAEVDALRTDTAGRSPLPVDHAVRLTGTRERARKAAALLHDAARDAALTPELRPLAADVHDVADRPLRGAEDALRKATADNPADRQAALGDALAHLADTAARIEEILRRNDQLAQDRLDRRRLEALAADQTAVAEKAKPGSDVPPDALLKAQRDLLDRLTKLFGESDSLKGGADAAAGREVTRLAAEAKALAALIRDLDAASDRLAADLRRSLLDQLAREQSGFAGRAAGFLARLDTAARLAGVAPPKPDDFRRVADLLAQDRLVDALTELEQLAQALDRTAGEFEKWAGERQDPKAAARQIARWQDDLRTRFEAATRDTPFEKLPQPIKGAFGAEQLAVLRAVERLKLSPDAGVAALRDTAVLHLRMAVKRVDADGTGAAAAMKNAVETLTRLAETIPTAAERLARTRPELDKIRVEQDSIIAAADQILRPPDRPAPTPQVIQVVAQKLAPVRARQLKLTDRLAGLDCPGVEPRQARAGVALKAAAADLKTGLPYDSAASLAWAKRELDRLREAGDGLPAADDRADELARKQIAIVEGLAALGDRPTVKQWEPLVAAQNDVFRQVALLAAPESPVLLHDAGEAVKLAEAAFRDGSKPEEMRRRARAAADALAALATRLNGRESDRDRVGRLADNRRQAVCNGRKLAGRPFNPDASSEARRQLTREVEELTHTRVGAAGQLVKRKVLDSYARLQMKTEPDRQTADQKQLAEALDELVEIMTDVELTTTPAGAADRLDPDPADGFLPSKLFADILREMARQQRVVRERANSLGNDVASRLRPAAVNPLAPLEERQRVLAGAVAGFNRTLTGGKEPGAADEAGKAAEAARLAADRLTVGQVRPAKEAAEIAAQRLRQMTPPAGSRSWGKLATELAIRQEAILNELIGLIDDPAAAAAQQKAQQEALARKAFELAHLLDLAAKNTPPGGPAGQALADAAGLARRAETMLADAAKKAADGMPADAAKLRAAAEQSLRQAAEKAMAAGPAPPATNPPPDPSSGASGEAALEAERAMRQAVDGLGPKGDPGAAERAMRRAVDALTRAARAAGNSPNPPPPDGRPGPGMKSTGNTGAGAGPTTPGELTPERIESIAKSWGDLPGEVKTKFVQDLQARYGEDYARSIKHYFEQLAERK
ncbi:MAG: hypothetical protein JWO38_5193 [Gemmataceae bacterium]|nr:hypothetical protein [Gemmataceae bacterium]